MKKLAEVTGVNVETAPDLIEASSDMGDFMMFSGMLRRLAVKLSKIANDLRLLSSGPRGGFNDINLPAVQPGSSMYVRYVVSDETTVATRIQDPRTCASHFKSGSPLHYSMPGKVNPVIPEAVNQTCFQVVGNDMAITMAAEAGQLQLNAFEPVIIYNLLSNLRMLTNACNMLTDRCVRQITANVDHCDALVRNSVSCPGALVCHSNCQSVNLTSPIFPGSLLSNTDWYCDGIFSIHRL